MDYKALITDFDNTVAGNGQIKPQVADAIKALIASGKIYSIATGRTYYDSIHRVCKNLDLKDPVIVHGGAHIIDPKSGEILWQENINDYEAEKIIEYFQKKNIYISVEASDCVYTPDGNKVLIYGEEVQFKKINQFEIKNLPKIIIPASKKQLTEKQIDDVIHELNNRFKDIHVIKMLIRGNFGLDLTSIKATKHLAILELMKMLHLKEEEVVGVGDGYNDYPLLTACGVKVAMGDAPQQLKDIADFIAPPQTEDGILKVIEKYF